jgi:DNA-binding NtrC family response regulator
LVACSGFDDDETVAEFLLQTLARALHRQSARRSAPFAVVNCPTLTEELLESELFGHAKGSFTGAVRDQPGRVEAAEGGTLFLDEIGDMPPDLQTRLLRVLSDGQFYRVGGHTPLAANVRVIAATHQDMEKLVKDNKFREDLYYRLNVFSIPIPPLRERREDIAQLVEHFIHSSGIIGKRNAHVSADAMRVLESYAWPGNARELQNVIERALILSDGDLVLPEHLPIGMRASQPRTSGRDGTSRPTLADAESEYIRQVLEECHGHRHKAAAILGISERNLYRKLKEFESQPEPIGP